jgi:NAD(P)-dependent dehydrogenase (short-subunit alcohol dehydrogenase family)
VDDPEVKGMAEKLIGKVAVVAGATRGAGRGIARALGEAGATVYCTGRSVRGNPSPYGRPETIEETAEMVQAAGGRGIAVRVDHTAEADVRALFERVDREQGRLDVLVDSVAGEDPTFAWTQPLPKIDGEQALGLLRQAVVSHLITAKHAAPLMIRQRSGLIVEVTDRDTIGAMGMGLLHDLVKSTLLYLAYALSEELGRHKVTVVSATPGFLRSESMLEHFGVTEEDWRKGGKRDKNFLESETPLFLGRGVAALAADPKAMSWSGHATSSWELGRHYGVTDGDGRRPDWGKHATENVMPQFSKKKLQRGLDWQERLLRRARQYAGVE